MECSVRNELGSASNENECCVCRGYNHNSISLDGLFKRVYYCTPLILRNSRKGVRKIGICPTMPMFSLCLCTLIVRFAHARLRKLELIELLLSHLRRENILAHSGHPLFCLGFRSKYEFLVLDVEYVESIFYIFVDFSRVIITVASNIFRIL